MVLDDIWLPGDLFKGLTAEKLGGYRGPDVQPVRDRVRRAHDPRRRKDPRRARRPPRKPRSLDVPEGAPLLSVERLSFTYGDKPVELRRGLYNTATHHYRNELN